MNKASASSTLSIANDSDQPPHALLLLDDLAAEKTTDPLPSAVSYRSAYAPYRLAELRAALGSAARTSLHSANLKNGSSEYRANK